MLKYLSLVAVISSLFGEGKKELEYANGSLEAKASYFFFTDTKMNDVYSNGGFQVQLSGSYPVVKYLQIYGSAGFREAWGKSLHFGENTTFWELPIDLGLKPVFKIRSWIDWYFAFGPRYFYVHQSNSSSYVDQTVVKNGIGLFCNTGFDFFFTSNSFIDFFAEYSYEPVYISPNKSGVIGRDLQVGGFAFGIGLGRAF